MVASNLDPVRDRAVVTYLDRKWSSQGRYDGYAQYEQSALELVEALRECGFCAEALDVGPKSAQLHRRLIGRRLVFNFVERIAIGGGASWYVPDVAMRAGAVYAGPTAATLRLSTDKARAKAACQGMLHTPRGVFVSRMSDQILQELRRLDMPVVVKPNFEAGSVGIADDVVAENRDELAELVRRQLRAFPAGILAEEVIEGQDVTVGFYERGGFCALPPVLYRPRRLRGSRHGFYDYETKNSPDLHAAQRARVHAECPAVLATEEARELVEATENAARALGVRGFGRVDFRLTASGKPYFLEINSLPDIDDTSGFGIAIATAGVSLLSVVEGVLECNGINVAARRTDRAGA